MYSNIAVMVVYNLFNEILAKVRNYLKKFGAQVSIIFALMGYIVVGGWLVWRGLEALGLLLALRKLNTAEILQSSVGRQSGVILMSWAVISVLALLIGFVFAEGSFRTGVRKGDLLRRITLVFAPLFIVIAIFDLGVLILGGGSNSWVYYLITLVEFALGIYLLVYGKRKKTAKPLAG